MLPVGVDLFLLNQSESGCGSSLGFANHIFSGVGSSPGVMEGSRNQSQASQRDNNRSGGCPKHTFCPASHVLLGLQIGFVAVLLPLVFCFVFWGYYVADRGLDLIERGRKPLGFGLFLGSIILLPSTIIPLLAGSYWLAFEGGASLLLGID